MSQKKLVIFKFLVLISLLLGGTTASLATGGRVDVGLAEIVDLLLFSSGSIEERAILFDLRMPSTVAVVALGINLSLAGLVLQTVTRNPLSSPSILGINQGAALAIVVGLMFSDVGQYGMGLLAIVGGLVTGVITFTVAGSFQGRLNSTRLILGGVAVGSIAYALVRFSYSLEDDLSRSVILWSVGTIADVRWNGVAPLALACFIGMLFLGLFSHRLSLMALGDCSAKGLGVNPPRMLFLGALLASAPTGMSVSVAGPIAFIGLVVPHIAGILFGAEQRLVIPATALIGAALMATADAASKWITDPFEIPVGVVVALFGAPYFLYQTLTIQDLQ